MDTFEDAYQALEFSIAASGQSKKGIAMAVYPTRRVETAMSLLSRALTPDNSDVALNLGIILTIMRQARPDDFIFYLCDAFGFERPEKKDRRSLERTLKDQVSEISGQLQGILKQIERLEKKDR